MMVKSLGVKALEDEGALAGVRNAEDC